MLTKVIESTSDWFQGESVVSRVFNGLPDGSQVLSKTASVIEDYLLDVKPEEGKTKLLVLALGAGEYWGSNRNGDYFPESALKDYHITFETFGNLHKNHKNTPKDRKYGYVEKSFWNDKMKRVELVVVMNNDECPEILSKLDSGEDIAVSMAAKLPYDICSVCGNKRTTAKAEDTCQHIRSELNTIYEDGSQCYAINEEPKFFDISFVWKPADRTAYVLKKVASVNVATDSALLAKQAGYYDEADYLRTSSLPVSKLIEKQAYIKKLGELEKRIKGIVAKKLAGRTPEEYIKVKSKIAGVDGDASIDDRDLEQLSNLSTQGALASSAKLGIVLRPEEFIKLVIKPTPETTLIDRVKSILPGIFSRLSDLSLDKLSEIVPEETDFDSFPEHLLARRNLSKYIEDRTLEHEPAVKRSITIMLVKKKPSLDEEVLTKDTEEDKLSKEASHFEKRLAEVYAIYKAAALQQISKNKEVDLNNFSTVMGIIENYI